MMKLRIFGKGKSSRTSHSKRTLRFEQLESRRVLSAVPIFHSAPEFSKKIYLDFDGQVVTDTEWTRLNNSLPIHAPAYDIDGDVATFSAAELANVEEAWNRVAEDFAPFAVDVTTAEPPLSVLEAGGQGIRVIVSSRTDATANPHQWWTESYGGVADRFFDAWNYPGDRPIWVFANDFYLRTPPFQQSFIGTIASHELGHSMGLHHDGNLNASDPIDQEYYFGHGTGDTSWGPIVAGAEHRNLTQWSKGEYNGASNVFEDDLAYIASRLGYRADDYGNSLNVSGSTLLSIVNGNFSTNGVIGGSTGTANGNDVDVFRFNAGSQPIDIALYVKPVAVGPNLDLELKIFHESNLTTPVATINEASRLDAAYHFTGQGVYYLRIDGVGKGNPLTSGYSDYGSLGKYTVLGAVGIPRVMNVRLNSSVNLGEFSFDTVDGGGDQIRTVPLGMIDGLSIVFSEDVMIAEEDLNFTGMRTGVQPQVVPNGFSYNPATFTAAWLFSAPLGIDQYLITLRDSIADGMGAALDGEWINPADYTAQHAAISEFPSGDGLPGGDFAFAMTILPGDLAADNLWDNWDLMMWDYIFNQGYDEDVSEGQRSLGDVNADGVIDQADYDEMNMSPIWWNLSALRLAADFNGDRIVDDSDVDVLVAHWSTSVAPGTNGDANGDGFVNLADAYILHNQMDLTFEAVSSSPPPPPQPPR